MATAQKPAFPNDGCSVTRMLPYCAILFTRELRRHGL